MARRLLVYGLVWLTLAAAYTGIASVLGDEPREALTKAVVWATGFPLATAGAGWLARRLRVGHEREHPAAWRTYRDGDRPRRWRHGWLRPLHDGLTALPRRGEDEVRVAAADVAGVAERGVTGRELWWVDAGLRVLEVTTDAGRIDLAVRSRDVAEVRGWLAGRTPADGGG